jgi:hypothetical protein
MAKDHLTNNFGEEMQGPSVRMWLASIQAMPEEFTVKIVMNSCIL